MIGTTWKRHHGLADPLLVKVMKRMGFDEPPLYEHNSPERRHYREQIRELTPYRDGPVNPDRTPADDPAAVTQALKEKAMEFGADIVGVTRLQPRFIDQGDELDFPWIIAIGIHEDYGEVLKGPDAVGNEAQRAYYGCAAVATSLGAHIRDLGYRALAHHNGGSEIQAIPTLYEAGFGELGKHGSLINRRFGANFRPSFVTTDIPLVSDQPHVFGVQDTCENCHLCFNNCPGDAIPSDHIVTEGIKRWLTDVEKCYPYSRMRAEYCHICVDVCPYVASGHKATFKTFMQSRKLAGYKEPKHK